MVAVMLLGLGLGLGVGLAAEWRPVECYPAPLPPEQRYVVTTPLADFSAGLGSWRAVSGGQQAVATATVAPTGGREAGPALRVDYQFEGKPGLEYLEVACDLPLPAEGATVGLWLRSDQDWDLTWRLRVRDASGEIHQIDLERNTSEGWRMLIAQVKAQGGAWGGDGNKRLDPPLHLATLVGDRPRRAFDGAGAVTIDSLALIAPRPESQTRLAVTAERLPVGNLYEPGETVRLRAESDAPALRWRVLDYFGREVASGATGEVGFRLAQPGYYQCEFSFLDGERLLDQQIFACAALGDQDRLSGNPFVGFCTHFQRVQAWPPEGMDLFARYGFNSLRDEIPWSAVEREPGQHALPAEQSAFLAKAAALGLDPLLILCYSNPHYEAGGFPNTSETWAAYGRWARFMVEATAGQVDAFEIWNEWSVGCGMGGKPGSNAPEPYAKLMQAAHDAIRTASRPVTIVGIGGEHSDHHFDRIEVMVRDAPKAMDTFSVHSYRYPRSPEETDLFGEIQRVSALSERLGGPRTMWVTEIGWPTHLGPRGVEERVQARYLARTMALLQATGLVERVHWYDFKNDGLDRVYNENNFGVVWHQRYNHAPKPAVVAASVYARQTAGATLLGHAFADGLYQVRFRRPDGRELLVVWTTGQPRAVQLDGQVAEVRDLMGNPVSGPPEVSPDAIYVIGTGLAAR